ncbi:hypothetical protein Aconfl_01000 [Algoriphagus confluentis]|uniref:Uncharacterized protein n=1 Tax=Algoriphagus confluentis TaxID=1697556 RepID=A0ABQ6PJW9_9BACT|nr:hypothetical protein Aconfl_01000 [Algoriphagus confluentis]
MDLICIKLPPAKAGGNSKSHPIDRKMALANFFVIQEILNRNAALAHSKNKEAIDSRALAQIISAEAGSISKSHPLNRKMAFAYFFVIQEILNRNAALAHSKNKEAIDSRALAQIISAEAGSISKSHPLNRKMALANFFVIQEILNRNAALAHSKK